MRPSLENTIEITVEDLLEPAPAEAYFEVDDIASLDPVTVSPMVSTTVAPEAAASQERATSDIAAIEIELNAADIDAMLDVDGDVVTIDITPTR